MGKRTSSAYWEEKRERWRIDVQKNGMRKTFYSSTPGRAGKRECHEKAEAWLDEGIIDTRKKVCDMAESYMEDLKTTTSKSHWRQYENYVNNYICKMIGKVRMEDLTEQHFQSIINKAYQQGKSKKTFENMRACEKNFLKFCRKSKATTLLCEDITIPKGAEKSEKVILQPDDIRKLFANRLHNHPWQGKDRAFYICISLCGCNGNAAGRGDRSPAQGYSRRCCAYFPCRELLWRNHQGKE